MRHARILFIALAVSAAHHAGGAEEGPGKAAACAACHGADGVSVSSDIPNLAAQKTGYLRAQLQAFREGTRKNPLMNAIASQLDDTDIDELAAYFSSLPGAAPAATSDVPAAIAKTRVEFPSDYKERFTRYTTINFPDRKQVRHYYANEAALSAAREGRALPDGSVLFVEVYKARLDDEGNPLEGSDGYYVEDTLAAFTAMEKQRGWGEAIPEILRNGDWHYAVFAADGTLNTGINQAKCLACHKPLVEDSYVFTLEPLREKAGGQP